MLLFSRPRTTTRAGVLAVAVGVLSASATTMAAAGAAGDEGRAAAAPVVRTDAGPVRGRSVGATEQYRGIPYAAPPVGTLRWRAPRPVAPRTKVLDATSFGPDCAQPNTPFGAASTSEDCLYLNVYTPAGRSWKAKLPVMVWIHGGGLASGRSRDYDPTPLVRDDTVVVTINYRLGALGFLAHPALSAEAGGSSGNYGLLDQQAALRWVQRNIGNFGGDRRKVTIFGESAGGLSVLAQVASPRAAGLFSRAIVQSGAYALQQKSQRSANAAGRRFAARIGCRTQAVTCLRSVPVRRLLAAQDRESEPTIDGRMLTRSISTALARGQFQRVPLMNGTTADEWRLMVALSHDLLGRPVTARTYRAAIAAAFGVRPAVAAAIATRYPLNAYPSPALALAAAGTDGIFACTAREVNQLASRYVPTYAYEFDRRAPQPFLPPASYPYGAYHAAELQYLFELPTAPRAVRLNRAQRQLARTMRQYSTEFAATGAPSGNGSTPQWPAYRTTSEQYQRLVPPKPTTTDRFAVPHQCAFWARR